MNMTNETEHVIGWALASVGSHSDLAVLLAIVSSPGGTAPVAAIAKTAKVCRKTAMRSVARLERGGLLTVERSSGSPSYYTPNIPEVSA